MKVRWWAHPNSTGFTLVELLIVIVVLAMLTMLGFIGYNGVQKRAVQASMQGDTHTLINLVEDYRLDNPNAVPSVADLSSDFHPSAGNSFVITAANSGPVYLGLSGVQNGVLFKQICDDLVSENYAVATNNGGQSERYISGCNVYNQPELQVNTSWTPRSFDVPVDSNALPNVVAGINYNDSYRPQRDVVEKAFYQEWNDRFLAEGGQYPVTSFWDPWCSGLCTWGTQVQTLPTPTPSAGVGSYCIEVRSTRFSDLVYTASNQDLVPSEGGCS